MCFLLTYLLYHKRVQQKKERILVRKASYNRNSGYTLSSGIIVVSEPHMVSGRYLLRNWPSAVSAERMRRLLSRWVVSNSTSDSKTSQSVTPVVVTCHRWGGRFVTRPPGVVRCNLSLAICLRRRRRLFIVTRRRQEVCQLFRLRTADPQKCSDTVSEIETVALESHKEWHCLSPICTYGRDAFHCIQYAI